jgi:FixJ family two-component response regulator
MTQRSGGSDERPCILVVEDDSAVRRSLQLLLRAQGYDVRAYGSALAALADDKARRAACLVADLSMPDVDGIELLSELRATSWQGPAVLISGHLTGHSRDAATGVGYDVVLDKPVIDSKLTEVVAGLLATA